MHAMGNTLAVQVELAASKQARNTFGLGPQPASLIAVRHHGTL